MAQMVSKTTATQASLNPARRPTSPLPSLRVQAGDSYPPTVAFQYPATASHPPSLFNEDSEDELGSTVGPIGSTSRGSGLALAPVRIPSLLAEAGEGDAPTTVFDARELIAQVRAANGDKMASSETMDPAHRIVSSQSGPDPLAPTRADMSAPTSTVDFRPPIAWRKPTAHPMLLIVAVATTLTLIILSLSALTPRLDRATTSESTSNGAPTSQANR